MPGDGRGPRVWAGERGQHLDGGRLAGTVRAEQAVYLAGLDQERQPVERPYTGRVDLDEIVCFDLHGGTPPGAWCPEAGEPGYRCDCCLAPGSVAAGSVARS